MGGVNARAARRGEERSGFPCVVPVELVGNSFFELSIKSTGSSTTFLWNIAFTGSDSLSDVTPWLQV
ncbi:hypothetical protein Heshes_26820 [Alicyclobacillus hesperidum]|uniref:Uncharacterized protein n=1 Tax=Alicyclobacillus hesperidum TaxID=89784 RepID=A0AA37U2W7_9BACL|nr:hypothetical protein Heshes_26820 [Alicyclobacillus hesperidum]